MCSRRNAIDPRCSLRRHTSPKPNTQVAAQEGAYVARLLNRGYDLDIPVPTFPLDEGTYRIVLYAFFRRRIFSPLPICMERPTTYALAK